MMKGRTLPALLKLLNDGMIGTNRDFAAKVFCDPFTISRHFRIMRADGLIRVYKWERNHQSWLPCFGLSDGRIDARKPRAMTPKEKHRRYRKAHPEYLMNQAEKARAKRFNEKNKDDERREVVSEWYATIRQATRKCHASART